MAEEFCDVGRGVTLCYEAFGDPDATPILLIMGLATQMIAWPEDFCDELAERGFYVVRFDNRDIGRSTHFDFSPPSLKQMLTRRLPPEQYTLSDMAEDSAVLLQKLARVHRDDVFAAKPARPKAQTAGPAATEAAKPAKPGPRTRVATEALKWFFALVSVAVAGTSLLGLWMALAYNREKVMLLGVLAAGAAIPLLILAL